MIDYIKYKIDGQTYSLINNGDGTWSRDLNAPSIAGLYNLTLEIGQAGIVTYIDSEDPRYTFYLSVVDSIERKADLVRYLPDYRKESIVFNEILEAENIELDILYNDINKTSLDIFIRTASIGKITRLEDFLKIKGIGSLEQRKSYLLTLLQKDTKINESVIKDIANTIAGSDCIVTFFGSDELDNPNLGFGLLQVQVLSPNNTKDYRYEDIARTLKPLVPAHLKLTVIKYFATWEDIKNNFADWNAVATMEDWQAVKSYIPPQ